MLVFLIILPVFIFPESRQALLIANSIYKNFSSLATPKSEARMLESALEMIGFEVTIIDDASREKMLDSLDAFCNVIKTRGGVALFHYGGHGVQVNGINYLIPSDADIPDERKVATRAIDLNEVMSTLDMSGSESNIVILDCCRNNPLPSSSSRSASRGLSIVEKKPKNTVIIFSAEAGTTAMDGLFTPALARALQIKNIGLSEVLSMTRKEVYKESNGNQIPGEYNQLFDQIYLNGRSEGPNASGEMTISLPKYSFEEEYNDNSKMWPIFNENLTTKIQDGKYSLLENNDGFDGYRYLYYQLVTSKSKDVEIECEIIRTSGDTSYGGGLLFGGLKGDKYYLLLLNAKSQFRIQKNEHGRVSYINSWTKNSAISAGLSRNKIVVKQNAESFIVIINNVAVYSSLPIELYGSSIGYYVSYNVGIDIDYIRIK